MVTTVTITGSGTPMIAPGRAGPGALVRHDDTLIQVDAGRATTLRLAEAGIGLNELDALLITHHHSDHLLGLTDLLITRWMANGPGPYTALPVHCPTGPAVDYLEHLFDHLQPDIDSRRGVSGYVDDPHPRVEVFDPLGHGVVEIARFGEVLIETTAVDHGDLAPAVGFRFTTPDGVVVVSGDTQVCVGVESLARGADIVVHEAFSAEMMRRRGAAPSRVENLAHHHAEAREVGEMASRVDVPELVVTHLIPPPETADEVELFASEIRAGGYEGTLTIADDLFVAKLG